MNFKNSIRGGRLAVLRCVLDSISLIKFLKVGKLKVQNVSFNGQPVSNPSVNKDSEMMSWHDRLGHPNFIYLKMFPSLFRNKSPKFFDCEI